MADEGYDAGSAFLQVFPSFKGVIDSIRKEAQKWGVSAGQEFSSSFNKTVKGETGKAPLGPDKPTSTKKGTESGGAFADGFKKRVEAALKTLPDVNIGAATTEAEQKIKDLSVQLRKLSDQRVGIDIDDATALAELDRIRAELQQVATESPSIQVRADTTAALAQLDKLKADIDKVAASKPTVTPEADTQKAETEIGAFASDVRAKLTAAVEAIPEIRLDANSSAADVKLAALRAEMSDLSEKTVGVDISDTAALAKIAEIRAKLDDLGAKSPSIQVKADIAEASAKLDAIKAESDDLARSSPTITPNVDSGPALAGIFSIKAALIGLGVVSLAPLAAGVTSLLGPLAAAGAGFGGIAAVAIPALSHVKDALDAQSKAADDTGTSSTDSAQKQVTAARQIDDAETSLANARRSADQESVKSAEAVQNARQSLSDAEQSADEQAIESTEAVKNARQSLADTERQAATQVQQADRNVTTVRQQAAQDQQQALAQVQQAEQSLAQAERTEQTAQESLTDARKDAVQELQDLGNQLSDAQLSLQQDQINLAKALQAQDTTRNPKSKSTSLDRRQAALDVAQARQALKEQQQQVKQLSTQKAAADKAGVKGSDQVIAAQQQLADAQQNVADGQKAVKDASTNAAKVQVSSAQKIADAQANAAETQRQAQEDIGKAQQSLADAQRKADQQREQSAEQVTKAQQGLSDAIRDQGYQQANSAASIAAAQKNLAQAQSDASKGTDDVSASTKNLAAAMAKLTPQEKNVLNSFKDLRTAFSGWAKDLEPAVLPIFTKGMGLLKGALGPLTPVVKGAAGAITTLEDDASSAFQKPFWKNFAKTMSKEVGPAIKTGGQAFGGFVTGLAGVAQALTPGGNIVLGGLKTLGDDFSTLGQNSAKTGLPGFTKQMKDLQQPVVNVVEGLGHFVTGLVQGLLPVAKPVLDFLAPVARHLGDFAKTAGKDLAPALQNLSGPLSNFVDTIIDVAGDTLTDVGPNLADIATSLGQLLTHAAPLAKPLGDVFAIFTQALATAISGVNKALIPILDWLVANPTLVKILAGIAIGFKALAIGIGLVNAALDIGPLSIALIAVSLLAIGIYELITNFKTVYNFVKTWAPAIALAFLPFLAIPLAIATQFGRIKGFVTGALKGAKNWIVKPAKDLITGFWNGIKDVWKTVTGWFTTRKKAIQGFFNNAAKWLYNLGRDLITGLWNGMKAVTLAENKWLNARKKSIQGFFNNAAKWLFNKGKDIFQGVWNGMKTIALQVNTWLGNRKKTITGYFANAGKWLLQAGKNIGNGLKNGISSALSTLGSFFTTPLNWIITNVINRFLGLIRSALPGVNSKNLPNIGTIGGSQPKPKLAATGSAAGGNNLGRRQASVATGGVLPGYTPGKDVHRFVSPTGGLLNLSGGEAVMRPEWTRAVGPGFVNAMNALSRTGGVTAVRKALGFAGGGILGSAWNGIKGAASATANFAKSAAGKAAGWTISHAADIAKSFIGHVPGGDLFKSIAKGVLDTAVKGVKGMFGAGDKATAGNVNYTPSAGVAQWTDVVLQALRLVGQPASLLNTTLRRMSQESGGNPNIVNNWDSNAAAGTPSKGLMQVIDPTFQAYRLSSLSGNIFDPLANLVASMRYAISRYGSLSAAYNKAGGYALGGILNPRMATYDSGGSLPPGFTLAYNGTGSHEPILTSHQLTQLSAGAGHDGPTQFHLEVPVMLDKRQIGKAAANFQLRNGRLVAVGG